MAIEDYYRDIHRVGLIKVPDGTGGYEYAYKIGDVFQGSVVRASESEQQTAGIRGILGRQYNITTSRSNTLNKDEVLMYVNDDNEQVFMRINGSSLVPPVGSPQHNWKGTTATEIVPDYRVVEE